MYISTIPINRLIFDDLLNWHNEFNRYFEDIRPVWQTQKYPAMKTWASEDGIIVDIELPGIDIQKVNLSVSNDELTVSGSRDIEQPAKDGSYHMQERTSGDFSRILTLPFTADTNKIEAKYKNGILRVRLVRAEEDKPKKIQIETT
ncbi:MAG: Hsp20/alpha crystallin family protein [Kiritimatiellae bacterium]|nr:Hsp20/alpha crystallin family protein [Kiritimatiellia bacterium]MDD5520090.1 Hsp20/alpha crystallin family protein [Kiritimatiellia bacterium]